LPLARLEQIAHDRYRTGAAQPLCCLDGVREAEYLMARGRENLDQLGPDEPGGSRDECGRPRLASHDASVVRVGVADHPQHPHSTRTPPAQTRR
jgi:hypothetical protein